MESDSSRQRLLQSESSEEKSESKLDEFKNSKDSCRTVAVVLFVLTALALTVRLYIIGTPSSVVFDEVHFGGFATRYMRAGFFMDVHPPLGKLMYAGIGKLVGLDEDFRFDNIGDDYIAKNVPYVALRLLPALLGVLTIPVAFLTCMTLNLSLQVSTLAAIMVLFDNALATQSRLILLDSPLICFTTLTVYSHCQFTSGKWREFSCPWWLWLSATGAFMGLTASVKWVGLFLVALIGLSTIYHLWNLLGDMKISVVKWCQHFGARAVGLILIPILVYSLFFYVHFAIVHLPGTGDSFMSTEFQASLTRSRIKETVQDIAYGATISIRHVESGGGYLHSHAHNYQDGSFEQQVTLYSHIDENNDFTIEPIVDSESEELIYIKNGDIVRLRHSATKKWLDSLDFRPPISTDDDQREVSCTNSSELDTKRWKVLLEQSEDTLKAISSIIRFVHVASGCHLYSHSVKLPQWGFNQQEVTCIKNGVKKNTLWRIEHNSHEKYLKDAPKARYPKLSFIQKFIELHKVMLRVNNGLTDTHNWESRPFAWPTLLRGINFWEKDHAQIYLIGNPIVWWGSTALLGLFFLYFIITCLLRKRQFRLYDPAFSKESFGNSFFFALGWALHYVPFYSMERQLFLHHYLPALYFAIIEGAIMLDLIIHRFKPKFRWLIVCLVSLIIIRTYKSFSPFTYGTEYLMSECEGLKWLSTWDFACHRGLIE